MRVKYRLLVYQQVANQVLFDFIKAQGYNVTVATDETIESLIAEGQYDMAILEEPAEGPTFKYVRLVRKYSERKPIIFVSNLAVPAITLESFNEGVSDYVEKPCNYLELAARIKAHLKYVTIKSGRTIYKLGNFTFDAKAKTLAIYDPKSKTDKNIPIRGTEAKILEVLCSYDGELCPRKTILEALNTDLVCDAINTAMRELFLQIVYGRSQSAFSEGGLVIGAGMEDLGKGERSMVGTMYGTKAKGVRYLEMTEGYCTRMALDENNEVIGYEFVSLGKMTDFIKKGMEPNEAYEKSKGTYGRFNDAVKYIDPRKE